MKDNYLPKEPITDEQACNFLSGTDDWSTFEHLAYDRYQEVKDSIGMDFRAGTFDDFIKATRDLDLIDNDLVAEACKMIQEEGKIPETLDKEFMARLFDRTVPIWKENIIEYFSSEYGDEIKRIYDDQVDRDKCGDAGYPFTESAFCDFCPNTDTKPIVKAWVEECKYNLDDITDSNQYEQWIADRIWDYFDFDENAFNDAWRESEEERAYIDSMRYGPL